MKTKYPRKAKSKEPSPGPEHMHEKKELRLRASFSQNCIQIEIKLKSLAFQSYHTNILFVLLAFNLLNHFALYSTVLFSSIYNELI